MSSRPDLDPTPPLAPVNVVDGAPRLCSRDEWSANGQRGREAEVPVLGLVGVPPWLAIAALAAVGCVLLLAICELLPLYAAIALLPGTYAWFAVTLMAVGVLAILIAFAYFFDGFLRLKKNRQLLEDRIIASRADVDDAARLLAEFVSAYPLDANTEAARLLGDANCQHLRSRKKLLLTVWKGDAPSEWLLKFRDNFQDILDRQAELRVVEVARFVAFKTAVSPSGLLDACIVLFWSIKLLGDLCRIYNLAAGPLGTALLLVRVVLNAYVAVRIDAFEEYADDTLENVMDSLPISDVAKQIVGRISVKSGTGLANYFLIRRLGKHAIGLLKPFVASH